MPSEPATPVIPERPGYLTTEFWVSILSVAAILFKIMGIDVDQRDVEPLAVAIAAITAGFVAVWGIVSRYVRSRAEVKSAQVMALGLERAAASSSAPVTLTYGVK